MTWNPLGLHTLGDDWVGILDVVASEDIMEANVYIEHHATMISLKDRQALR